MSTQIIKNSARCAYCGTEIESKDRHEFKVHYCPVNRKQAMRWAEGAELVPDGDEITWNFAVDGGKSYIRRCGSGFIDTSEFDEIPPRAA
jgi:hypothetical protein